LLFVIVIVGHISAGVFMLFSQHARYRWYLGAKNFVFSSKNTKNVA